MRKFNYFLKILIINAIIVIFSIIIIDLVFGDWFSKYFWIDLLKYHKDKRIEATWNNLLFNN